jgi:hypothetical protein
MPTYYGKAGRGTQAFVLDDGVKINSGKFSKSDIGYLPTEVRPVCDAKEVD